MSFAPIVERELRLLSRRAALYRARTITAVCALLIGLGVAFVSLNASGMAATLGRNLFVSLTALTFAAALLAGPVLTADCLSEEKRNGTLGLLFLCGLRGRDIVAGKLIALTLPAAQCLLVTFPILAFSFVLGGVTGGEFWRVTLVLMNTLLLSLSSAMAVSSLSRQGTRALGASVIFLFIIVAGLPLLPELMVKPGAAFQQLSLLSPFKGLMLASDSQYQKTATEFWRSCGLDFLLSAVCLALACARLPFSWRDKTSPTLPAVFQRWLPKKKPLSRRAVLRRRLLLDDDPLVWIATRKRASTLAVWVIVGATGGICFFGFLANQQRLEVSALVGLFYLTHALLKILIAWDASHRFADERENGALELLLCSPVEERGLWRSWLVGLKRTYLLPLLALAAVEIFMLLAGMLGTDSTGWWSDDALWGVAYGAGLVLFFADTYAMSWFGVWQGIAARNSTHACLNTVMLALVAPMAVTLALLGLAGMFGVAVNLPIGLLLTIWFAAGCATDMAVGGFAMLKLNEEFRAAVAHATGAGHKRQSWRVARKLMGRAK